MRHAMRKLIITIILLASVSSAWCAEWKPEIGASVSYSASSFAETENIYSAVSAGLLVDIPSISFGPHQLHIPISAGYSSRSIAEGRRMKQAEAEFAVQAGYGYSFSELFTLRALLGVKASWYLGGDFLSISYGAEIIPLFTISDIFSIGIPVSCYGSASGWELNAGILFLASLC